MALEKERSWYEANLADLLMKYRGKWIVVRGDKLVGVYETSTEAYNKGVEATRCEEILVRCVIEKDEPFSAPALTLGLLDAPTYS
jgi:hypothetical protein